MALHLAELVNLLDAEARYKVDSGPEAWHNQLFRSFDKLLAAEAQATTPAVTLVSQSFVPLVKFLKIIVKKTSEVSNQSPSKLA